MGARRSLDHGLMRTDRFYTYRAEGVRLVEWIADLIHGHSVENRYCAGCRAAPER